MGLLCVWCNISLMAAPKLYDPNVYLPEIHSWIESGKTLRDYCRQKGKPSYGTVYDWLEADAKTADKLETSRFARARDLGEEQILAECMAIADKPQIGEIVTVKPVMVEGIQASDDEGKPAYMVERKTADMIEHRKLRIDTRLKLLAKWNPKKYSDKSQHELTGADGGPVQFVARSILDKPE